MKGIVLAGVIRNEIISDYVGDLRLPPVYDKPMIYYLCPR